VRPCRKIPRVTLVASHLKKSSEVEYIHCQKNSFTCPSTVQVAMHKLEHHVRRMII
jgi:hypothetical protein